MPAVLMVLTGAKTWTMKDGTPHPTGFWSREFVEAHKAFTNAGLAVRIATPAGVIPVVDELSFSLDYNKDQADVDAQKAYLSDLASTFESPLSLADVDPADFDVVFLVGGHGPMQDMAVDPTIGGILAAILDDPKKIVSAVCHGPAGFLSAHRSDGSWLFKGWKLTGFSNEEETGATFAGNAPWLLEDRLRLAGAEYVALPAWAPNVVVDGNLITGQQQVSVEDTAAAVLDKLRELA
ncbi:MULTISPECIES: type 1 glutamine amidotransferase domain-containing protein [unclassified Microbacterium]|uniref:type 1 glutamine amidotransferase domain-containing protein n=1 Tax=unclassified Microbacterium TaxID=2609290 RepID=UPI000CFD778E|nr:MULTISPECIES: type 1 glutamine amidotransferase domain-containing protein [unclassified Microbacterium]PQZ60263.1 type 1 glutamine amidotransferase domain-containing protein [Microbacterium sp. MYb43]PQZ76913.1 type 1 glutamine amidotransferase domain-containing protein [Microbacterium sp. MYb40]PRB23306.1 type 1 glutamine amidotransferase domain-containing protein [Microbacterium sp. MYb54]PRB28210.1 type 1 glutamine amidotransferase domain-containing protein [Microbacterium sp. MYb50]PRB6